MKRKIVALALKQNLSKLEIPIIEFAAQAEWNLELYINSLPLNWSGHGIITDSFSMDELSVARDCEKIPIVSSRMTACRDNMRFVIGDTRAIAKIVADFFISRGYRNFASFTIHPLIPAEPEVIATIMPDWALKFELEKRGFTLEMCYVREHNDRIIPYDLQLSVSRLRKFLRKLPKPCACFTTNVNNSYVFYRACEEENIKVPQEIAFLANNDINEVTENTSPTTSAVAGEISKTGYWLAKVLDDMMKGVVVPREPRLIEPSGIVPRQSTDILAVPDLQTAQAINFLLSNYPSQISVLDAAEHARLHPDMMNYLFKKHLKKTPGRFLRELRMNKAMELLKETNLSLGRVADETGYGSDMSFSLAFKREYGITPGEYRAKTK